MNDVGLLHLKYDAVPRLDEKESGQLVSEMDEWKEVVGNAATIFTIVQFLVGAQVGGNVDKTLQLS